jgi:hypothetical protein
MVELVRGLKLGRKGGKILGKFGDFGVLGVVDFNEFRKFGLVFTGELLLLFQEGRCLFMFRGQCGKGGV